MHRIGRTGRAGAKGVATMLATPADARLIEAIEKLTKQSFAPVPLAPQPRHRSAQRRVPTGAERVDTPEDERLARERARAYVPPSQRQRDPIFDMPYLEHAASKPREEVPAYFERRETKKRPVAALLGGFRFVRSSAKKDTNS